MALTDEDLQKIQQIINVSISKNNHVLINELDRRIENKLDKKLDEKLEPIKINQRFILERLQKIEQIDYPQMKKDIHLIKTHLNL